MLQGCWYQGAQLPEDAEEGVRAPEKGSSAEGIQVHAHSGWPGGGKKVLGSEPLGPQRQNSDGPGMGVTKSFALGHLSWARGWQLPGPCADN